MSIAPPTPRTFFIAEVSSNHHRDLDRCRAFIEAAHKSGCAAVKFQLFKVDELFAPEALAAHAHLRNRTEWELPVVFLPDLAETAHSLGLQFSCTPFYLDAVKELEPYVDFYKIASYELMWDDLLHACAKTEKPVFLSTGMADMAEITHAVEVLRDAGCEALTLLHCISGYPTPPREANLAAIETLRQAFKCPVGLSDHTVSPGVIGRAVHRWGAETVEFHLDLEGKGAEYETGHCWLPDQIAAVIESVNAGLSADGSGEKTVSPVEAADRDWRADPSDGLRPLKHIRKSLDG
ncbi:MAG: N-acetylneuraminate synthase family protein [Rhodospirillales bacterium]|nr:N-acetylneuraminate synthase family protein [Rhodospirillales bacterium]